MLGCCVPAVLHFSLISSLSSCISSLSISDSTLVMFSTHKFGLLPFVSILDVVWYMFIVYSLFSFACSL